MRLWKIQTLSFVVVLVASLVGCSSQFRSDASHSGYNQYESTLKAGNVANLALSWKGVTGESVVSSPAIGAVSVNGLTDIRLFISSKDGYLRAYEAFGCAGAQMCSPLWSFFIGNNAVSTAAMGYPVIGGAQKSYVYVLGGDGYLHAIDAATGEQEWVAGAGGPSAYSSPTVVNNVVYVVSGGTLGGLLAFDAVTGAELWSGAVNTKYSSPAVANGYVYVGDENGIFYAYSASGCGSGFCSPAWTSNGLGPMKSSPAVANGTVYVGSEDGHLYALNANGCSPSHNCSPLWRGTLPGGTDSSPAVANGKVYIAAGDGNPAHGNLYAFDSNGVTNCSAGVCAPLWAGVMNGIFPNSSAAIANGVAYVGSDDGHLYMFDAATGSGLGEGSDK